MTRQPHDQFAKQYLEELLTPIGKVETSRNVPDEVRQIDIWFVPVSSTNPPNLGLLGKMASTSCVFEPFRNAPTEGEIRNCLLKLYAVQGNLLRQAKREKRILPEEELPCLWILSPSCSSRILEGFGAKLDSSGDFGDGVYFLPKFLRTALVAINQLPTIIDSLWLRVLGRGTVQKQAVEELMALAPENPLRDNLLEILASWRANLEVRENLSDEDKEVIMNLSPVYLRQREEWRQEGRQEGQQEGRQEGRRDIIENLLKVRFGSIDEKLSRVIEPMLHLPTEELTRLLLTLNQEELLARFREDLS